MDLMAGNTHHFCSSSVQVERLVGWGIGGTAGQPACVSTAVISLMQLYRLQGNNKCTDTKVITVQTVHCTDTMLATVKNEKNNNRCIGCKVLTVQIETQ
jgi:hypothetical protein